MNTILNQFLSLSEVKEALKINEINSTKRSLCNSQKKKFEQSLTLSKLVANASDWYDKNKSRMTEAGVTLKKDEFFEELFGFQKSFAYKLNRVSKLEESVVSEFTARCDAQEREGKASDRSVNALLKFAKGGEEGEEGEERAETILTLSYKTEDGNVAIRINSNGEVATKNTPEEIEAAIEFLRSQLSA